MSAWHGVGRRRREVYVNERICSIRIVAVFIIVKFFYLFGIWCLVSCNVFKHSSCAVVVVVVLDG